MDQGCGDFTSYDECNDRLHELLILQYDLLALILAQTRDAEKNVILAKRLAELIDGFLLLMNGAIIDSFTYKKSRPHVTIKLILTQTFFENMLDHEIIPKDLSIDTNRLSMKKNSLTKCIKSIELTNMVIKNDDMGFILKNRHVTKLICKVENVNDEIKRHWIELRARRECLNKFTKILVSYGNICINSIAEGTKYQITN